MNILRDRFGGIIHAGLLVAVLLVLASPAFAQTSPITFNVTPASAVGNATPVATWSTTPAASSCTASGGWSGPKAASGTQALATITANTSYTLNCSFGTLGTATVEWIAPTLNTDGTPLTNLAAFRVYYGQSASSLSQTSTVTNPAATSRDLTGLASGPWFFAVRAVSTAGIESDTSNVTSLTVSGVTTRSATANVVITAPPPTVPNPPTGVTVRETTVFNLTMIGRDIKLGSDVGVVDLGKPCGPLAVIPGFRTVARSNVTFTRPQPAGTVLVARCS